MPFHDLKLPATWGVTGCNFPIQGAKSTCNPMFECFEWLHPKESPFNFLPLTYNGDCRIDLALGHRCQNSKISILSIVLELRDINRWKFQGDRSVGVLMTSIQPFSVVRSFDVTWWPDLEWPGSEIFTTNAEKMYKQVCQKWRRSARPFLKYLRKIWGGVQTTNTYHGVLH